jgi:protein-L-isoaspartate(D-aspartate) O-methyltransferase
MQDRSEKLRSFFARYVAARGGARDDRIEQAFAAVPREPFVGPGPWSISLPGRGYVRTPDDDPAYIYQDTLVAIDTGRGINIGEPTLHARCLDALALRAGDVVLHVGAGVGYYTALLAHLVGDTGRVHAFEIEADLAARAKENLAHLPWVDVQARSGIADHLPKADAVYVNAGITQPSWAWLDALRTEGRLIFPLQPVGGFGAMLMITRPRHGLVWPARFVSRAGFIACAGPQDDEMGRRLAAVFAAGGSDRVQSFRVDDAPDASCWCRGDGWWLSTAPAISTARA